MRLSPGKISSSRACLFNLLLVRRAFVVVWLMVLFGMLTCLFDGSSVGMCSSSSRRKLEVAAVSNTAVSCRSLLLWIRRAHLRASLLDGRDVVLFGSRPWSNQLLEVTMVGWANLDQMEL